MFYGMIELQLHRDAVDKKGETSIMKDKIYRFMRSRYGNDQLSSFLTWTGILFMLIDCFAKTGVFYFIGILAFTYGYIRVFSRQYEKRAAQNRWFLEHTAGIRNFFRRIKKSREAGKDFRIFTCPRCAQMIRIPRGKGKIEIRCPKCGNTFIKKS